MEQTQESENDPFQNARKMIKAAGIQAYVLLKRSMGTTEENFEPISENAIHSFQFWTCRFVNLSEMGLEEIFKEAMTQPFDGRNGIGLNGGNIGFLAAIAERYIEMGSSYEERMDEGRDKNYLMRQGEDVANMIRHVYKDDPQILALFESYFALIKTGYYPHIT